MSHRSEEGLNLRWQSQTLPGASSWHKEDAASSVQCHSFLRQETIDLKIQEEARAAQGCPGCELLSEHCGEQPCWGSSTGKWVPDFLDMEVSDHKMEDQMSCGLRSIKLQAL